MLSTRRSLPRHCAGFRLAISRHQRPMPEARRGAIVAQGRSVFPRPLDRVDDEVFQRDRGRVYAQAELLPQRGG